MSSEAMVTAENSLERRYTVAVTGGCGFLGQHLIRLLQTQSDHIETIRVLDFFSFQRELDYVPVIRTESILGTVTSMEDVMTATKDVLTVFHLASVTDHQLFPDHHISRMVNVKGTKILIEACEKNDVSNLIYVSDISVVMGYDDIKRGTEERTPHPWVHLFQDGITKCAAEKLVLKANGKKLSDDKGHLKTIILRPVNIYGELDSYLLPHFLELAVLNEGSVLRMGTLRNRAHLLYAGNAAWALICAHVALSKISIQ